MKTGEEWKDGGVPIALEDEQQFGSLLHLHTSTVNAHCCVPTHVMLENCVL